MAENTQVQNLADAINSYMDSKLATIGGSQPVLSSSADFTVYVPNDTSMLLTGKQTPYLSLGEWSKADTIYTASLSYSGDGMLSTNIGSISDTTLTVTDEDGIFSGIVTASAGTSYAATTLNFSYNTEAGGSSGGDGRNPIPVDIVINNDTLTVTSTDPTERIVGTMAYKAALTASVIQNKYLTGTETVITGNVSTTAPNGAIIMLLIESGYIDSKYTPTSIAFKRENDAWTQI